LMPIVLERCGALDWDFTDHDALPPGESV